MGLKNQSGRRTLGVPGNYKPCLGGGEQEGIKAKILFVLALYLILGIVLLYNFSFFRHFFISHGANKAFQVSHHGKRSESPSEPLRKRALSIEESFAADPNPEKPDDFEEGNKED